MVVVPETVKLPAMVTAPLASVIRSVSSVYPIVVPLIITLSTVSVVSVPTVVRLDAVIPLASVEPVRPVSADTAPDPNSTAVPPLLTFNT